MCACTRRLLARTKGEGARCLGGDGTPCFSVFCILHLESPDSHVRWNSYTDSFIQLLVLPSIKRERNGIVQGGIRFLVFR